MAVFNGIQKFIQRNRFLSYGVPFLVLLVGGSFALKNFSQLRYTFRRNKLLTREEAEQLGINMKPQEETATIETEYKKLGEMNLDNWENVRGPRPWEETDYKIPAQKQSA